MKLTCLAPAKLNLFLHVVGRRPDGYHLLQTLFRFIDLHDTLHFTLREDGAVHRTNSVEGVAEEQDLCVRAARLLQRETGCTSGVDITVEKRIPLGGGMGGGSSDAATTLLALNKLWNLGLSRARLMQFGLTLGGGRAGVYIWGKRLCRGRGRAVASLSFATGVVCGAVPAGARRHSPSLCPSGIDTGYDFPQNSRPFVAGTA